MKIGRCQETATSHYFDEEPSTPSRPHVVTLELPDLKLEIVTDAGVFGAQKQKVDLGTRTLLLLAPDPPPEGEIMDLGCGYGPIALALGKRAPRARIWAVDVNQRALELVGQNARKLGVSNVTTSRPEDVPEGQDWKVNLNPNSLEVLPRAKLEPSVKDAAAGAKYQFERQGYFSVDRDSRNGKLVFNRSVSLKDTWAKEQQKSKT